jgi:hypothetical protein
MVSGGRTLVAASGPDLVRLKSYVIDVTAGGLLSSQGKVTSSPAQIDAMAVAMEAQHDAWVTPTSPARRVVLYAHGGLVGGDLGGRLLGQLMTCFLTSELTDRSDPRSRSWLGTMPALSPVRLLSPMAAR